MVGAMREEGDERKEQRRGRRRKERGTHTMYKRLPETPEKLPGEFPREPRPVFGPGEAEAFHVTAVRS